MKALYVTSHCAQDENINVSISDKNVPIIQQDELLVKMVSSGINPSDALALTGYFKHAALPRIPGRDFAGIVVEGPDRLVGKKIWGTGGDAGIGIDGTQATFIKLKINEFAEVPNNMDVLVAGAQTLPYVTAYYALVERARIKGSESVLVVGALGQVGQAAMSIAHWKGCKAIALVRGKVELARATELGWHAVNSEEDHLLEKILAANQGNLISVILNSIGNLHFSIFIKGLADFGRIVTISARENAREATINLFDLYRSNQELIGINTVHLNFAESSVILNALKPGFESGTLLPLVLEKDAMYLLEKASSAYQEVLNGTNRRVCIVF